jgi:probable rRNA maturation factor
MSKVSFHNTGVRFSFLHRNKVKRVVEKIFSAEKVKLEHIGYVFCSDKELLEMNVEWLDHDTYTDIITFDLSSGKDKTAEVYISIDRVRDNSTVFGVSFQDELRRVIFHGALHLCGYTDKTKAQQSKMRTVESKWLSYFNRST